jgi:hypothetical protein
MTADRLTREEALTRLEMANLIEERALQTGRLTVTLVDFQTAFGAAYSSHELAKHFVPARMIARERMLWTPAARERAAKAARAAGANPPPPETPAGDWPKGEAEAFWFAVLLVLAVAAAVEFVLCFARHA